MIEALIEALRGVNWPRVIFATGLGLVLTTTILNVVLNLLNL